MWGLFIGQLNDNVLHQHYALQICIASKENFALTDENGKQEFYASCFINSNVKHRFNSNETSLILLLNPISSIGHQLHKNYYHEQITKLNSNLEQLNDSF